MAEVSDVIRKNWGESDRKRDAGLVKPEDVLRFDNICYGEDSSWQLLDVYLPKAFADNTKKAEDDTKSPENGNNEADKYKKIPVIVSVHGGAWVYGDKDLYQYYCMSLARKGFAVVNYTYRLAPEFKFPSPVEDTNLVMHFIFDNADKYGFDTDRIYAVGDSAGAHLLSVYVSALVNPKYFAKMEGKYGDRYNLKQPDGLKFRALALNCGKYSFEQDSRITEGGDGEILDILLEDHGTPEEMAMMNVYYAIDESFPTSFIMTASDDFLKDQSILLAGRLLEKKVPYVLKVYGSATHPLYHVFHCDLKTADSDKCNSDECRFFMEV